MTRVQRVALGVGARSRPSTYRGRKAKFCNILCLRGQIAAGYSCNINMYVGGGRRREGAEPRAARHARGTVDADAPHGKPEKSKNYV